MVDTSRRQVVCTYYDHQLVDGEVLDELRELMWQRARLPKPAGTEITSFELTLIFNWCLKTYNGPSSALNFRARRADQDIRDYLAGAIKLPDYVLATKVNGGFDYGITDDLIREYLLHIDAGVAEYGLTVKLQQHLFKQTEKQTS